MQTNTPVRIVGLFVGCFRIIEALLGQSNVGKLSIVLGDIGLKSKWEHSSAAFLALALSCTQLVLFYHPI